MNIRTLERKVITGIPLSLITNRQWFLSIMLTRCMFFKVISSHSSSPFSSNQDYCMVRNVHNVHVEENKEQIMQSICIT